MRTLLLALSIGIAAGTIAHANVADEPDRGRSAGILTCRTLPHVSLVFGRTRVAACRFEADRSTFTQSYGALLPSTDAGGHAQVEEADNTVPETIVWRVVTADGEAGPGLLDGSFAPAGPGAILRGASARLEPIVGGVVMSGVTLATSDAQIEVGMLR